MMCSFDASCNVAGVACLNAEPFEQDGVWIVQAKAKSAPRSKTTTDTLVLVLPQRF